MLKRIALCLIAVGFSLSASADDFPSECHRASDCAPAERCTKRFGADKPGLCLRFNRHGQDERLLDRGIFYVRDTAAFHHIPLDRVADFRDKLDVPSDTRAAPVPPAARNAPAATESESKPSGYALGLRAAQNLLPALVALLVASGQATGSREVNEILS